MAAAIDLIRSLPDHWVDAEKLKGLQSRLALVGKDTFVNPEIITGFAAELMELLAPKSFSLAELIDQGNAARQYQWVQAKIEGSEHIRAVIAVPSYGRSTVWLEDGGAMRVENELLIPLPDLPKLQWPESKPVEPVAATLPELTTFKNNGDAIEEPVVETEDQ